MINIFGILILIIWSIVSLISTFMCLEYGKYTINLFDKNLFCKIIIIILHIPTYIIIIPFFIILSLTYNIITLINKVIKIIK